MDGGYLPQVSIIAEHLSGREILLPANGVDDFVFVNNAAGIEVLAAAVLRALGIADRYRL